MPADDTPGNGVLGSTRQTAAGTGPSPQPVAAEDQKPFPELSLQRLVQESPPGASAILRYENSTDEGLRVGAKVIVFPLRRLADSPGVTNDCADDTSRTLSFRLVDTGVRPLNKKTGKDCIGQLTRAVVRNGGRLPLSDKSPPTAIRAVLDMSKRQFRSALGFLISKRRVIVSGGEVVAVDRQKRTQLLADANHGVGALEEEAPSFPLWPHRQRVSPATALLSAPATGVSPVRAGRLLAERKANRALASEQAASLLVGGVAEAAGGGSKKRRRPRLGNEQEEQEAAAWVAAARLRQGGAQRSGQELEEGVEGLVTVDSDGEGDVTVTHALKGGGIAPEDVSAAFADQRREAHVRLRSDGSFPSSGRARRGGQAFVGVYDDEDELFDDDEDEDGDAEAGRDEAHSVEGIEEHSDADIHDVDYDNDDADETGSEEDTGSSSDEEDSWAGSESATMEQDADESAEAAHPVASPGSAPRLSDLSDEDYQAAIDPLGVAGLEPRAGKREAGEVSKRGRAARKALVAAARAVPGPKERARGKWRQLREKIPQPDLGGGVIPADESDGSDLEHFKALEGGIIPGRADAADELEEEADEDEGWAAMVAKWLELTEGDTPLPPGSNSLTLKQLRRRARRTVERVELRRGSLVSSSGIRRKRREARRRVEALLGPASANDDEEEDDKSGR